MSKKKIILTILLATLFLTTACQKNEPCQNGTIRAGFTYATQAVKDYAINHTRTECLNYCEKQIRFPPIGSVGSIGANQDKLRTCLNQQECEGLCSETQK